MSTHSSILAWKSHGEWSLVGYNTWVAKESDMTEATKQQNNSDHLLTWEKLGFGCQKVMGK